MSPRSHVALPEGWDYDRAQRPARTILVPLEPIGIGTPFVEAFSSYEPRLAAAHDMSASELATQVLAPLLGRESVLGSNVDERARYFAAIFGPVRGSINGSGLHAATWVNAVRELTGRPDLRWLTLLDLGLVIPARGQLTERRRVCGRCLHEWRSGGDIVYEPLLWQFRELELCPIHESPLQAPCPICGKSSPVLATWSVPGRCTSCGGWRGHSTTAVPQMNADAIEWQRFVGAQLGSVLAEGPSLSEPPSGLQLPEAIKLALRVTGETMTGLGSKIGVSVGAVSLWCAGRRVPSVAASLRICRLAGFNLTDFLFGRIANLKSAPASQRSEPPAIKPPTQISWDHLENALRDALVQEEPPSLGEILRRFGVDRGEVRRKMPELGAAVRDRHSAWRRGSIAQRRADRAASVKEAVREIHAQGVYPGIRQVKQHLGREIATRDPHVRRAWKQGLQDVGLL
jgi:hypothetical protein